jgi:all-trans-retinol 13,14-reductase
VLTAQWGDYGLPPARSSFAVHATIAEHYFEGGSYPVGGAGAIATAMVPLIERTGGSVVTSAEVAQILLESAKAMGVRMSDGREFRAAMVLSDAGAANTFDRMFGILVPGIAARPGSRRRESALGTEALWVRSTVSPRG